LIKLLYDGHNFHYIRHRVLATYIGVNNRSNILSNNWKKCFSASIFDKQNKNSFGIALDTTKYSLSL